MPGRDRESRSLHNAFTRASEDIRIMHDEIKTLTAAISVSLQALDATKEVR
jgi:hypothetical protein